MKTITTLLACIIGFYASAQKLEESKVPAAVIKAFKAKYTTVKKAEWEKEGKDYEASFDLNKIETSALFSPDGELLEVESEISQGSLPKAVAVAVAKDYPGYKIEETEKVETKSSVMYEVEVEKGEKSLELLYDSNGKLMKKTEEADDDKE